MTPKDRQRAKNDAQLWILAGATIIGVVVGIMSMFAVVANMVNSATHPESTWPQLPEFALPCSPLVGVLAGWCYAILATRRLRTRLARNPPMTTDPFLITHADLGADTSRALIAALDAELRGAYSEPGANHFALDADEVAPGRGAFLVIEYTGVRIGCGAVRRLDADTAELKRMYVAPTARGLGLGHRLLAALESEARQLGVRRLVLETGTRQEAALALYRAAGFQPIPLYGEYCLSPDTSICLGKEL